MNIKPEQKVKRENVLLKFCSVGEQLNIQQMFGIPDICLWQFHQIYSFIPNDTSLVAKQIWIVLRTKYDRQGSEIWRPGALKVALVFQRLGLRKLQTLGGQICCLTADKSLGDLLKVGILCQTLPKQGEVCWGTGRFCSFYCYRRVPSETDRISRQNHDTWQLVRIFTNKAETFFCNALIRIWNFAYLY